MRRRFARIIRLFSKLNPRCKVTAAEEFHTDYRRENQGDTGDDVHCVHCTVLLASTDTRREFLLHGKHNRHQGHFAVHDQARPQVVVIQTTERTYHLIQDDGQCQRHSQLTIDVNVVCTFDLRTFINGFRLLTKEGSKQEQTTDLTTCKVGQQVPHVGIAQTQGVSHERHQDRHTHDGGQQHNRNVRKENRFLKVEFLIRKDIRQNRTQKTI